MKKETAAHESYLVFARKFRPQTFDEIVGQEPIATTLKNAISKERIAQSFLFTGPRGVGKTSTARILAKALNCEKGLTSEPCNKCSACDEITRGIGLDVLEIDGASNRGIEEIRDLRENVKFKPSRGRFKVYIIDEVHMLTGEAFNALLKTLEEPPPHVKFIFATTEVHKVPLTILSRCQRFNFKRISTDDIAKKLKEIAKKEKIKASEKALFVIAKTAEGSLRDGESLLDQMASFCEGEIKEEDVTFSLGLTSDAVYFSLLEGLKSRDGKLALEVINQILSEGGDLIQFSHGLLEIFRDLLVYQIGGASAELIEGIAERGSELKKISSGFSRDELFFGLTLLQQLIRDIRWSRTPRFLVEACLLKIVNRSDLKSITQIMDDLKSDRAKNSSANTFSEKPVPPPAFEKKKSNFDSHADQTLKNNPPMSHGPVSHHEVKHKAHHNNEVTESSSAENFSTFPETNENNAATATIPMVRAAPQFGLNDVGRVWPELLERVKAIKMSCGTYLAEAEPVEVMDGIAVFGLPGEFKFHKESLEKKDNKDLVRSTLMALLNCELQVSFVVTEPERETAPKKPEPVSQKDAEIITSALNIFEGSKVVYRES